MKRRAYISVRSMRRLFDFLFFKLIFTRAVLVSYPQARFKHFSRSFSQHILSTSLVTAYPAPFQHFFLFTTLCLVSLDHTFMAPHFAQLDITSPIVGLCAVSFKSQAARFCINQGFHLQRC